MTGNIGGQRALPSEDRKVIVCLTARRTAQRILVAVIFCLGAAARARGQLQCSSFCDYVTTGYYCATGYEEHNLWYARYEAGSSNNVMLSAKAICKGPDGQDVMGNECNEPVYDPACTGGGGGGGGDTGDDGSGYGSPILISFKGDQDDNDFALCGPDDPVAFDILADGKPQPISWTRRGAKVGLLVLDRNHNSLIDSGAELFGNHTPAPDGAPPPVESNGYLALAAYDLAANGGNEDRRITAEDRIWSSLQIWIDKDHDGVSQAGELFTLADMNIVAIGLDYGVFNNLDRYGNRFRFKSYAITVGVDGRLGEIRTWDVFFVTAAP